MQLCQRFVVFCAVSHSATITTDTTVYSQQIIRGKDTVKYLYKHASYPSLLFMLIQAETITNCFDFYQNVPLSVIDNRSTFYCCVLFNKRVAGRRKWMGEKWASSVEAIRSSRHSRHRPGRFRPLWTSCRQFWILDRADQRASSAPPYPHCILNPTQLQNFHLRSWTCVGYHAGVQSDQHRH